MTSAADDSHCPPCVPATSADDDAHCPPNGNKRYKCNYCCSVFSCNSSLKRHMGRKHPSESMAHSGTCQCQHCPFKVFRYSFFGTTPNFLNGLLDSPFLVRSK